MGCQFFRYGPSTFAQVLQLINLFGIFWGVFFMEAFGQLVLAGAFAGWYWTFKKPENLPTNGLSASFYRSIRYHLGWRFEWNISQSKPSCQALWPLVLSSSPF